MDPRTAAGLATGFRAESEKIYRRFASLYREKNSIRRCMFQAEVKEIYSSFVDMSKKMKRQSAELSQSEVARTSELLYDFSKAVDKMLKLQRRDVYKLPTSNASKGEHQNAARPSISNLAGADTWRNVYEKLQDIKDKLQEEPWSLAEYVDQNTGAISRFTPQYSDNLISRGSITHGLVSENWRSSFHALVEAMMTDLPDFKETIATNTPLDLLLQSLKPHERELFDSIEFEESECVWMTIPSNPKSQERKRTPNKPQLLSSRSDDEAIDLAVSYLGKHKLASTTSISLNNEKLCLALCGPSSKREKVDFIPFSREAFAEIMGKHHLPVDVAISMMDKIAIFKQLCPMVTKDPVDRFVLRTYPDHAYNWTLALSWDRERSPNVTSAMLLGVQENELEVLIPALLQSSQAMMHPMLLPVTICEIISSADSNRINQTADSLHDVGLRTIQIRTTDPGSFQFSCRSTSDISLSESEAGSQEDTLEAALEYLTRSLNAITLSLATHEKRSKAHLSIIKTILSTMPRKDRLNPKEAEDWRETECGLRRRLNNLQAKQECLLSEVSTGQRTAFEQLQILFNVIAQKDALENFHLATQSNSIAKITKEDSHSMKTIATLTMIFLPVTAVATIFSMGVFDWDNHAKASASFGIFWAVAVPLTVIVLSVWGSWLYMHARKERASEIDLEEQALKEQSDGPLKVAITYLNKANKWLQHVSTFVKDGNGAESRAPQSSEKQNTSAKAPGKRGGPFHASLPSRLSLKRLISASQKTDSIPPGNPLNGSQSLSQSSSHPHGNTLSGTSSS